MSYNFFQLMDIVNSVTADMPESSNVHCLVSAVIATDNASKLYPESSQHNGLGDAFRHAYWSASMCFNDHCSDFNLNCQMSKRVTDKYEEVTKDSGLSLDMDKKNNEIARNLASQLQSVANQYTTDKYGDNEFRKTVLKNRIAQEIAHGTFYHIVNGRLTPTNICETIPSEVTGKVINNGNFIDLKSQDIEKIKDVDSNCKLNEGFIFYCDRPEPVMIEDLTDSGKWLNKAEVTGIGQVYVWHHNKTGKSIKSCLLIHNPNGFPITIDVKRAGLTQHKEGPDTKAWVDYFKGCNSKKIEIEPNSYNNVFLRTINSNEIFGSIAELEITKKGTSEHAKVNLYDIAFLDDRKSGNAKAYATSDAKHLRGVGNSYITSLMPATIEISGNPKILEIGNTKSSFGKKELIDIIDNSNYSNEKLLGCFGQQIDVSLIAKNSSASAGCFKIFMGSKGGPSHPVFKLSDGTTDYRNWVGTDQIQRAADLIEIGIINSGESKLINFSVAVSGMGSAPFVIGVRKA